jgi:serine/threonine-protein kinase RsbW
MTSRTFHMPNRIDAVDPMVLALKGQLEGILADETMFRFDICLSEALANLVVHAKTDNENAQIEVTLDFTESIVKAEVSDPDGAQAFDIRDNATELSNVDEMAESGRGLGLILECADAVDYGMVRNRNRLSMTFLQRT